MYREVTFNIHGVGLVPDYFYRTAEEVIALIPDEWDEVFCMPQFETNERGWPIAYLGGGWVFTRGGKYAAFITEHPKQLLEASTRERFLERICRVFERAEAA